MRVQRQRMRELEERKERERKEVLERHLEAQREYREKQGEDN